MYCLPYHRLYRFPFFGVGVLDCQKWQNRLSKENGLFLLVEEIFQMRYLSLWMLTLGILVLSQPHLLDAQEKEPPKRFDITANFQLYPQATPKELMGTLMKTIQKERFDYLVAHLMEPTFVDNRLATDRITPSQFSKVIQAKFKDQPELLRDLLKLLNEGEVEDSGDRAIVKHKDVKNHQVYLKKIEDRWFIENKIKDNKPKE
jgi:hypothetical protein